MRDEVREERVAGTRMDRVDQSRSNRVLCILPIHADSRIAGPRRLIVAPRCSTRAAQGDQRPCCDITYSRVRRVAVRESSTRLQQADSVGEKLGRTGMERQGLTDLRVIVHRLRRAADVGEKTRSIAVVVVPAVCHERVAHCARLCDRAIKIWTWCCILQLPIHVSDQIDLVGRSKNGGPYLYAVGAANQTPHHGWFVVNRLHSHAR
jgi:hypothetical protein